MQTYTTMPALSGAHSHVYGVFNKNKLDAVTALARKLPNKNFIIPYHLGYKFPGNLTIEDMINLWADYNVLEIPDNIYLEENFAKAIFERHKQLV